MGVENDKLVATLVVHVVEEGPKEHKTITQWEAHDTRNAGRR